MSKWVNPVLVGIGFMLTVLLSFLCLIALVSGASTLGIVCSVIAGVVIYSSIYVMVDDLEGKKR